jgi:hypothetical protein
MGQNLTDTIRAVVYDILSGVHTSFPGVIKKYDPKKRRAEIIPSIKRPLPNGTYQELPVLVDIPVHFPSTARFSFSWFLEEDDPVEVIVQERCLEYWKDKGGKGIENEDFRWFSLADAIAIPGLFAKDFPKSIEKKGFCIQYDDMRCEFDGEQKIFSIRGVETIALNGTKITINGEEKSLVLWEDLNMALKKFITELNLALTTTPIAGNGAPQPSWVGMPVGIDISSAQTQTMKVGGS